MLEGSTGGPAWGGGSAGGFCLISGGMQQHTSDTNKDDASVMASPSEFLTFPLVPFCSSNKSHWFH